MLILTRKTDEAVFIGENIKITVLHGRRKGELRIGIDAPKDIPIYREEIHQKIQHKKQTVKEGKIEE